MGDYTIDSNIIISTHISPLFPSSQAHTYNIGTHRLDAKALDSPSSSVLPEEHASYASVMHTSQTGTIVMRVLHGGRKLELVSLSTPTIPIRFVLPTPVVPCPAMFMWDDELHIIALTTSESIFRIVLSIAQEGDLWNANNVVSREYMINGKYAGIQEGLVYVHGAHCVLVGMSNGSLIRFETKYLGSAGEDDQWSETLFPASGSMSRFSVFTSFLSNSNTENQTIVSIATYPSLTDVDYVWTLSRDRVLRLWKPTIGCVASRSLPSGLIQDGTGTPNASTVLLDKVPQALLHIFEWPRETGHNFILVFSPTSPIFGGVFHLIDAENMQLLDIGIIPTSKYSAHSHLQDFMFVDGSIYTLWDHQGESVVEIAQLPIDTLATVDLQTVTWNVASYSHDVQLTPTFLDDYTLPPGSMAENFFDLIMRPGMFSPFTLQTALDHYIKSCESFPGPTPPQLLASYTTLGESIAAIVGCTVNLLKDPETGTIQYGSYWNALKRDWEGFIARCREIERSARWPLVLGAISMHDVIVIERERFGSIVTDDTSIKAVKLLREEHLILDEKLDILNVVWEINTFLGDFGRNTIQSGLDLILHQEIAFSYGDTLQDLASQIEAHEEYDDDIRTHIQGKFRLLPDVQIAVREILGVLGYATPEEVKMEEMDLPVASDNNGSRQNLSITQSDWYKALIGQYINTTVDCRYELCYLLITLFFFDPDTLSSWDPTILADTLSLYRGLSMLQCLVRQPTTISSKPPLTETDAADDVVSLMQNMQVSRSQTNAAPSHSLVHRLLHQSKTPTSDLAKTGQDFLTWTGLLDSVSPAEATAREVYICEEIRQLGYFDAAREMLSWLPRTPSVVYVLSRLWLNLGRTDDAAFLLEKLAGSFGSDSPLSKEEKRSLAQLTQADNLFTTPFFFYNHVSMLFKNNNQLYYDICFKQLSLSVAPPRLVTADLWGEIIRGYTDLGEYDEAYYTWVATPYEAVKQESVVALVYRMCEEDAVDHLMSFNFGTFADDVEEALSFKARNVDPRLHPDYSRILYSWYITRGDYRSAASIMYRRARKIHDIISADVSELSSLATEQLDSYLISMNALSLVDSHIAWIELPGTMDVNSIRGQNLTRRIPEDKYSTGKYNSEFVQLSDIQREHALLSAQIDIVKLDPSLAHAVALPLASSIVLRLATVGRFDAALTIARSLDVEMTEVFMQLTIQCMKASRHQENFVNDSWLLANNISSWAGASPSHRAWQYLRDALMRYDGPKTDYAYTKIAYEIIVTNQQQTPPDWLVKCLQENEPEYLIRVSLRYEQFERSVHYSISLIASSLRSVNVGKSPSSTWLPYNLIDQVLQEAPPSTLGIADLKKAITDRIASVSQKTTKLRNERTRMTMS